MIRARVSAPLRVSRRRSELPADIGRSIPMKLVVACHTLLRRVDYVFHYRTDFSVATVAEDGAAPGQARPSRARPPDPSTRREAITMSTTPAKSVLITGANAGIGK